MEIGDQHQGDDGHGYVDPEDGPPGPLGEVTAQDRPHRSEAARDAEEQRQGSAPLVEAEGLDHDAQSGGEHDGASSTLDDPEGHDPGLGRGALRSQAAHGGSGREDDDPEHHHLAVPDGVSEAAAEREKSRQ